ncbi:ATP-binding cassette domain-containing protein, partial [Methylobacterium sp.]|uniref:ATP-binding cassette domain-containing protein n=1 Tax=Methylobacterium sp. TaxID=409 RepID=UPI002635E270
MSVAGINVLVDETRARMADARPQGAKAPLLSVRGVSAYYGSIRALKNVDIDVHEGEIVALIGANGAGKSTLMMTIFG